ncbi:PadR family transcriptional regulator [Amycolatopsis sp.]|uniref:PadR family transcriptional regulator n=1 Tax=Amycolatopsis sp. TaxID=37632 RepID=UPI002C03F3ED|nr:helix-turn-helix transcriptional regulator [Amycolatopsis sp.]HVV10091.1 helix-turn-helix transcriptional regulator [Amycolatopsis sp.]
MSVTRLFVLGALARWGPMHGHGIRRQAQTDRTELWTDIKPGSLYGALARMAGDGLIEVACTQQEGNLPERTVYRITDQGRRALAELRARIIADTRLRPDPLDLALVYSDDCAELREMIEERLCALRRELASWQSTSAKAAPFLEGLEPLIFEHAQSRLEGEIGWHERLAAQLKGKA